MVGPFFLCGAGILLALCAACFYLMGKADATDERERQMDELKSENAKLREYAAVSIPLPLDGNRSAIHPDDIIGNNVGGVDFFRKVTEMYLTRYPRDGQPALWVVRTEDGNGNLSPYVCWGGRCNAVHKQASQTYSAEYLETYDENKRLEAENAKLRALLIDAFVEFVRPYGDVDAVHEYSNRMRELGVETDR